MLVTPLPYRRITMLTWLTRDSLNFPPLNKALNEPNGLLAAGGDLTPERLIHAYRHGCFPWYQILAPCCYRTNFTYPGRWPS